ncbi:MAG TPA: hypothetical protein PLL26_04625 [Candidatus Dojkabacteria bacterium]|nr:hypothetical protein [Candidatus Dojkabacteria bacterium]
MISFVKYLNEMLAGDDADDPESDEFFRQGMSRKLYNQRKQMMKKWQPHPPSEKQGSGTTRKILKKTIQPPEKQDPGTYSNPLRKVIKKGIEATQE